MELIQMPREIDNQNNQLVEQFLRERFDATLDRQVRRYVRAKVHKIIPVDFYSAALGECQEMYVAGSFFGCITLCQSVAEGLSRFLAEKNTVPIRNGFICRITRLKNARVISESTAKAFKSVFGEDRNDFHHLNKNVEQDYETLEARSLQCLDALYAVRSEVFAYDIHDGRISAKNVKYWSSS